MSKLSKFAVASLIKVFNLDKIHLSSYSSFETSMSIIESIAVCSYNALPVPSSTQFPTSGDSAFCPKRGVPIGFFIFIRTNFDAFHSLFAKFEADSSFSGMYLMSFPGVIPIINDRRNASVPYLSIISSGSIPFPKLLDIFLP